MEASEALRLLVEALEMEEEADWLDLLAGVRHLSGELKAWRVAAQQAEDRLAEADRLFSEEIAKVAALRTEVAAYRAVLAAEMRRGER